MKKSKKVLVTGLAAAMLLTNGMTTMAANGGCGVWQTYYNAASICDNSQGCGWFWLEDTNKSCEHQKRTCVKADNTSYTEYRTNYTKIGCC